VTAFLNTSTLDQRPPPSLNLTARSSLFFLPPSSFFHLHHSSEGWSTIEPNNMASPAPDQSAILKEVLEAVKTLQLNQVQLSSNVDAISGRVNVLAGMKEVRDVAIDSPPPPVKKIEPIPHDDSHLVHSDDVVPPSPSLPASQFGSPGSSSPLSHVRKPSITSRIILTTYPGQSGINPLPMDWGNKDPQKRGPVVVSRGQTTIAEEMQLEPTVARTRFITPLLLPVMKLR